MAEVVSPASTGPLKQAPVVGDNVQQQELSQLVACNANQPVDVPPGHDYGDSSGMVHRTPLQDGAGAVNQSDDDVGARAAAAVDMHMHMPRQNMAGGTPLQTESKHRLSNYSLKALWFAACLLFTYLNLHNTSSLAIGDALFLIAIGVFFITDVALAILLPKWGYALVYMSWFLLESALCLLVLFCNRYYAFAILAVLVLIFAVALLQPNLQHLVKKYVLFPHNGDDRRQDVTGDDDESQHLDHIFDISQGIANCGSMVTAATAFLRPDRVGTLDATGFFFFCTVALALYLMLVITVRCVGRPHATCLSIVLVVLLFITLGASSISIVVRSQQGTICKVV